MISSVQRIMNESELRLQTPRLDLLPIARSYASEMFELLNDVTLHRFIGGEPPASVEALSSRYEYWEERHSPDGSELWLNWAIRERDQGSLIGHLQAGVRGECADIAWVIGSRWQGQGYASEAASFLVEWLFALGVKEVRASIHPDHIASITVAERAGLHRTDQIVDGEVIWRLQAVG